MRFNWKTRGLRILTAGAVAMILAGAGAAAAQGPAPCGGQAGPGARMAQRLGLDEKQQESVAKIREDGRRRDLALRKEIMRLRNELHGEMLKDDPDEGTVLSLSDKVGDLQNQLRGNRLQDRLAIRKLLTPEQRDRMLMMGERGGRGESAGRGESGGCGEFRGRGEFGGCGGRHGHGGPGPRGDLNDGDPDEARPEPDQE